MQTFYKSHHFYNIYCNIDSEQMNLLLVKNSSQNYLIVLIKKVILNSITLLYILTTLA